jgi:alkylation response protein AidB-like acyl-CoA dehydrogenase
MGPEGRQRLSGDVEGFCREVRPIEDRCDLERRFNDRLPPPARQYGLLGMPVPEAFGGRGADAVTCARALARIGREGTGVRTVFSALSSLGEVALLARGREAQKGRYLPASCRGPR